MRGCSVWLLALFVVAAGAALERSRVVARDVTLHPVDVACEQCHLSATFEDGEARKLVASEERLCGACHQAALKVSHPSGFRPRRELPAELPVDWKGDLTCSTCHAVHSEREGRRRVAENGKSFCLKCHQPDFFASMRDGGVSLLHSGHLDADDSFDRSRLDPYSVQCMGCHDREAGGDAPGVMLSRPGVVRHGSQSANHPIDVDYREVSRFGGYRAPERIDPAVMLPGGRLSCVSCHAGYASEHGAVVRTRRPLCMECHDL